MRIVPPGVVLLLVFMVKLDVAIALIIIYGVLLPSCSVI